MKVTVIIPTKNRPASLLKAVFSIYNQTVSPFEVIIVDQSPKTTEYKKISNIKRTRPKIKLKILNQPRLRGLTAARNLGLKYAKGEIVQFLDDDSEIEKSYILKLQSLFYKKDIDGLAGKIIESKKRQHPFAKKFQKIFFIGDFRQIREECYYNKSFKETYTNSLPGVAAFHKRVFKKYKYDERLKGACIGEDLDFSFRAAKKFKFLLTPRIKIFHNPDSKERLNQEEQAVQKVLFYKYHYKKNIPKTFSNKIIFIWLNIGFLCHYLIEFDIRKIKGFLTVWCKDLASSLFSLQKPSLAGLTRYFHFHGKKWSATLRSISEKAW